MTAIVSKRVFPRSGSVAVLAALLVAGCASATPEQAEMAPAAGPTAELFLDIAFNDKTFAFTGPAHPNDKPANGAPFIIQGYIYPAGTFERSGPTSGILADGSPEFPDQVIGRFYCKGWFVNEGGMTTTGPDVSTTQMYDLTLDENGRDALFSEGIELKDVDVPFRRAITGGTGRYLSATGQVIQTRVGDNATGAPNATFNFALGPAPSA